MLEILKLYEELLLEMPKRISPITKLISHLTDPITNNGVYKWVIKNKPTPITSYNQNPIVTLERSDSLWIYGLNKEEERIEYFIDLQEQSVKFLNKTWVTQKLLWSSGRGTFNNISQWMVFNYILPIYKTIMSDKEQSEWGERFWHNLVNESFKKGLRIYLVDFNTGTIRKFNNQNEFNLLCNSVDNPWGSNENHARLRIAISLIEFN